MSSNTNITFIGDVALDEYYQADYFPKIKEKIMVNALKPEMGGMIANAASVFASYGGRGRGITVTFMAALNSGAISKKLCENLNQIGIETSIVWDDTLSDSKTIIILAENEHTVFIPTLNLQKFELSEKAYETLTKSNFIYSNIVELKPLQYRGLGVKDIFGSLVKKGVQLWCDIDVADFESTDDYILDFAHTIFMNEMGVEHLKERLNTDVVSWLFQKGVQLVIVTKAENGCSVYSSGGATVNVAGIPVKVKDVTGAGDTFCSSFLYSYIKTNDVTVSAEFANFAAARAVTIQGARSGSVDVKTVIDFIKKHDGNEERFLALLKGVVNK
jgi:ribokinase